MTTIDSGTRKTIRTLADLIECVEGCGDRPAVIARGREEAHDVSGSELVRRARRRAAALAGRSIGRGQQVALFAPAGTEWIAAALGVLHSGATLTPIDAQLDGEPLAHVLRDAAPALVWTDAARCERIAPVPPICLRIIA